MVCTFRNALTATRSSARPVGIRADNCSRSSFAGQSGEVAKVADSSCCRQDGYAGTRFQSWSQRGSRYNRVRGRTDATGRSFRPYHRRRPEVEAGSRGSGRQCGRLSSPRSGRKLMTDSHSGLEYSRWSRHPAARRSRTRDRPWPRPLSRPAGDAGRSRNAGSAGA